MKFEIIGRPEFYFELTKPDVESLIRLALRHYDGACIGAAMPARSVGNSTNGLLVMWLHRWIAEDDSKPQRIGATWRELDLVLKITEIWHSGGGTDEDNAIASKLHFAFRAAMQHFNENLAKNWQDTFVKP